jgi:hypothetical protein
MEFKNVKDWDIQIHTHTHTHTHTAQKKEKKKETKYECIFHLCSVSYDCLYRMCLIWDDWQSNIVAKPWSKVNVIQALERLR